MQSFGDEVAKSACKMMAGLIGDLMKVRQKRMMQHQLQAADPHGGGGGGGGDPCCLLSVMCMSCTVVEHLFGVIRLCCTTTLVVV